MTAKTRAIRVLIVEDTETDYAYLRLLLERSHLSRYEFEWAASYQAGMAALALAEFDVGLFDYNLGGATGVDLLRAFTQRGSHMPIILLTGAESPAVDQEASASGAADFLCKANLDTVRLERSIRYAIRHAEVTLKLRRATLLLRGIANNLPVIVGRLDAKGRIVEAEGQGLAIRGMIPEELIGCRFAELYPESRESVDAALKGGSTGFTISRSGTTDWEAEFFVFSVEDEAKGAIFFGRDITTRRQLEKRLLSISDEEQHRIGADLHDGLGQHLTGTACLATALRDQLKIEHPQYGEQANQIAGLVNSAIDLTRMFARGLCPFQVETCGLYAALEDLAAQVEKVHGVQCKFENGGPHIAFDPDVAVHLYRIAQEAINNAIRHGAADKILVKIDTQENPNRMLIEDNGKGFDCNNHAGSGLGLHLMEHRASIIGGAFKIYSQEKHGSRIECILPLRLQSYES